MLQSLKKQSKKKILRKLKLRNFIKHQLWQHCVVLSFMLGTAWLFDKYIEAVLFSVSHTVIRTAFDKQYHSNMVSVCTVITLGVTFIGLSTALPVGLSVLSTVPICFIISWIGYIIQDRIDLYAINAKLRTRPELTDREVFIAKCKELKYNDFKTFVAVKFFVDKIGIKELWNYLCETQENPMEYDSLRRMKYRIQKDLFKK